MGKFYTHLICISFLFLLFFSHIPSTEGKVIYPQAIFSVLFFAVFFYKKKFEIKAGEFFNKKFLLLISAYILFLIYCGYTLSYSANQEYGELKLSGLILNILPAIIAVRLMAINWDEEMSEAFYHTLLVITFAVMLLTIIKGGFSFGLEREILWSHTGYGRFTGFALLAFLIYFFRKKEGNKIILAAIAITVAALYLSGLRAAIISTTITMCIMFIFNFKRKNIKKIFTATIVLILSLTVLVIISEIFFDLNKRYIATQDDSILSRIEALKLSQIMIEESFPEGKGLGGYNNLVAYKDMTDLKDPAQIKYPHNIFIESLTETGLMGLIFTIIFLFIILQSSYRINKFLFCIFIYFFLLAQFSYSIQFQKILLGGLGLYGIANLYNRKSR